MAVYKYDDDFIVSRAKEGEIDELETFYLQIAQNLQLQDPYLGEWVKAMVYIELCRRNIEADGFANKMKAYQEKANWAVSMSQNQTSGAFGTIAVERG